MSLVEWSWLFLVIYIAGMLGFGWVASRRIGNADDFATARSSYGPYFLALAFAATTASGATFLGSPGLGYEFGMASVWSKFLYPMGVYFGVLITIRLVATSGHRFGNRSIPEYLGDRYRSDGVRLLVSVFSLVLFFYIAGQLVSGLVMFEVMLGLEPMTALIITSGVLLVYVVLGGAHADIITDGIQGMMMLGVAIMVIVMFLLASGVDGGFGAMVDGLRAQDEGLVGALNPAHSLYDSWWAIIAVLFAHIPLGMLPHIGNKVWALKHDEDRMRFVKLAFAVGLAMGMLGLGGILARGVLGPELLDAGRSANEALPALFIELLVWMGTGGMMAAFAGPLVLGALWRGVTLAGAFAGLITGMATFALLRSGLPWLVVDPSSLGPLSGIAEWLAHYRENPYACAVVGEAVSIFSTWAVSMLTRPLPKGHLDRMFASAAEPH